MPDPRNRLQWNATCKVHPAVSDLQAIKDNYGEVGYKASEDCTVSYALSLSVVPDGEIRVITAMTMYNGSSVCDMQFQVVINGNAYTVAAFNAIAANDKVSWTGIVVLMKDDYVRGGYFGGGATDIVSITVVGYKLGVY